MPPHKFHVGVDLDNTIVCYDFLFHKIAVERNLIDPDFASSKTLIRNHLRATGRESEWTAMQGVVYGTRMQEALPFPGVNDFFVSCQMAGIPTAIISHRTLNPISGPACNLHTAARQWLDEKGFSALVPNGHIYLEETRARKIERLAELNCTHFIDDLPEFLTEPAFPKDTVRIHFDPERLGAAGVSLIQGVSWQTITRLILP